MDESAAAASTEVGTENRPQGTDGSSETNASSSTEDTADINHFNFACNDCGLTFTHLEVYKSHLHQHALEEEEDEDEEEGEAGDNWNLASELRRGDGDQNGDEDMGDDVDWGDMSSSLQVKPSCSLQGVGDPSQKAPYFCLICGKVYRYLVSFRKHQQQHDAKSQAIHNLHKYECPDCGMKFIRRARLLGHLRIHRSSTSFKSMPPRCNQCNEDFTSLKSWIVHVDEHKRKPFWCLSCATGFMDEGSLDRHLQGHSLRQYGCNICHKSFDMPTQLMNHLKTHAGAKPHQCTLCGKSFSYLGSLYSHRKKQHRPYVGSSGMAVGMKSSRIISKKQVFKRRRVILAGVKEEPENDPSMAGTEEHTKESETQKPCEDAESDPANSEDSDCGEPMHQFRPSQSEGAEPLAGSKPQEIHRDHRYWEWECCVCDMGFDDMSKLHLHYIKHATGELPIPQDDILG